MRSTLFAFLLAVLVNSVHSVTASLRMNMVELDFRVKADYDYNTSTEENYSCDDAEFVGKYQIQRSMLDYSHHKRYTKERQLLHDQLIDKFLETRVQDFRFSNITCESPLENWLVFTGGPMGSGKGHTMQWLSSKSLFPLDAFVNVNPDEIRVLLPEFPGYLSHNPNNMGFLTQKEAGYISEVLTYDALLLKRNVLVDGTLRDVDWYSKYIAKLRVDFPLLRIAIIHVSASLETVLQRARKRALVTGRIVPEEFLTTVVRQIPESMRQLGPLADFYMHISNEDGRDPCLELCTMRKKYCGKSNLEPGAVEWSLEHYKNGDTYIYRDNIDELESIEYGWFDRFANIWVMQCAIDERLTDRERGYGHDVHDHHSSPRPVSLRKVVSHDCSQSHDPNLRGRSHHSHELRGEDELNVR